MRVMFVPMDEDLDMVWAYHAQGWDIIKRLDGNHGYWSWLVIDFSEKRVRTNRFSRLDDHLSVG